ncbi:HEPN domain-containing protein [Stappia indica]|uniref:HEPN domain-containing protein n=1 Tax=Stappia indica TaxID=538381 RepID=UPI0009F63F4C|nr:HEPN domain-containing protein [Stappia indica]MCC4243914.1 HEPN domain-containing protein [Stappia indica]
MTAWLHRDDLRKVAEEKLADARLLFDNRRYSAAYYLCGYSVEIAIKARIAGQFREHAIPERKLVEQIYKHDLDALLGTANLRGELERQARDEPGFAANWAIVKEWKVEARYAIIPQVDTERMLAATGEPETGILPWIRQYW